MNAKLPDLVYAAIGRDSLGSKRTAMLSLAAVAMTIMVLWFAFATLVVPRVIDSAYRGESLPFLNRIITGQAENPVDVYLRLWRGISIRITGSLMAFWLLTMAMSRQAFFERCVGKVTPGTLGAIRMWTCAILLITTMWDDLGSIALLPLDYRLDMGTMKLLEMLPIRFDQFLTSEIGLKVFQRITEALLVLGIVGWRTRLVIPLCALFALVMNGILREYTGFWHQNLVPIYVLIVLSFTRCADGWSLDRLWRVARGRPVTDPEHAAAVYGWARYACWVPIALTYASAGFSKLRATGLEWISARNMKALLFEQALYPRAGNFSVSLHLTSAPDIVFVFLAVTALLGEALFITVLFSRTSRRFFPAIMILMHVGIVFLQDIVFFDLMLLLWIFYDFDNVRKTIAGWMARMGSIEVIYDGACVFCVRTMRVLNALDLFDRLEFVDFRRLDLDDFNERNGTELTRGALEHEMFLRRGRKTISGFDSFRVLALALPALWPLSLVLFLPGARPLGRVIYRYVSRNRLAMLKCDGACSNSIMPAESGMIQSTGVRPRWLWAAALAAVIATQCLLWLNRIEFYPFTSVQMFAGKPGTVVTYYRTMAHWHSGRVSSFYLEDTLGVMSINSRYEGLFHLCFGDKAQNALCSKTLAIMGSAYNNRVESQDKLSGLEIQRWNWDFAANPRDPQHGQLEARFVGDVPDDAASHRP